MTWRGSTAETNKNGGGSGGGVSAIWGIPSYQSNLSSYGSPASSTMRNVPDVALTASPNSDVGQYEANFGGWFIDGGTSMATPLWAAFTALVNERRAANGLNAIGFPNPSIYSVAESPLYSSTFHDITKAGNLYYAATPGYDDATGWGSYVGAKLLEALSAVTPTLSNIEPTNVRAGHPNLRLTVTGAGLDDSSVVYANGSALKTGFVSSTELQATVPASALASPGSISITVQIPTLNGTSSAATLTVTLQDRSD